MDTPNDVNHSYSYHVYKVFKSITQMKTTILNQFNLLKMRKITKLT